MMNMSNYWDAKREGRILEKASSLVNYIAKCMDNTGVSLEDCLKAKEIVEREELFV